MQDSRAMRGERAKVCLAVIARTQRRAHACPDPLAVTAEAPVQGRGFEFGGAANRVSASQNS